MRIPAHWLLLLLVLAMGGQAKSKEQDRPNILFLFADDYTYEALGHLGLTDIETPNLDRLARRGTSFSHAYNMGSWSGAVCVASRTMLMTGRTVWHANAVYNQCERERASGRFWPEIMRAAGYRTYFSGKWHVKAEATKAFDVVRHERPGMPKDTPASYNRPQSFEDNSWNAADPGLGGFWEGGKHWSEVTADDAIDFLQDAKTHPNPFFMYIAFNAPHDPRQSPQEYLDKYPVDRIKVPTDFLPLYPYAEGIGAGKGLRDEKLAPFPRTPYAVQVHRREYYALITHLDAQIGRVLQALEKSEQADNTVIFFTADHGLAVGHHGLFGKQNQYDVSVRVPFIMAGPQIPQGKTISAPIYLQDGMATSIAMAGVATPAHVEFQNLLPLIAGTAETTLRTGVYGAYLNLQRAITFAGYKLIDYPRLGVQRLYNLTEDPTESTDLAGMQETAEIQAKLVNQLQELQKTFGDKLVVQP